MTNNVVAHPTKRSAKAKLINKNCGRFPNFLKKCCDGKSVSNDDKKNHYSKASCSEGIPLVKAHS